MADKKISALTGATTPLAGTEVLPVVQGGATVKVAVSDLTAGRAVTAASVNKVAITAPATASTLTIADGKTLAVNDNATLGTGGLTLGNSGGFTAAASKVLTANNSLTLAGTDATTQTFPTTSATIARTDAAQTFAGIQSISDTTDATSTTAASLKTAGGLAVAKKAYFGDVVNATGYITTKGSTSVANASATTIFTISTTSGAAQSLRVFCNIADAAGSYSLVEIVYDRTNARIAVTGNDLFLSISLSGMDVKVTQTFGSTQTVYWGYTHYQAN